MSRKRSSAATVSSDICGYIGNRKDDGKQMMKPILFNTEMVRAILDGRKTVTRRAVKPPALDRFVVDDDGILLGSCDFSAYPDIFDLYPSVDDAPYKPGDIIYVRETWFHEEHMQDLTEGSPDLPSGRYSHRYIFKADNPEYPITVGAGATGWHPSIHMPKEAARLFLRVTDVRAERLQGITEDQAKAEGIYQLPEGAGFDAGRWTYAHNPYESSSLGKVWSKDEGARNCFRWIWDSTIKPKDRERYGWEANPWVWVIEFERISKEEV